MDGSDAEAQTRVALVTGAARGLGLLVATDLARRGFDIAGLDRRGPELRAAMESLAQASGRRTLALVADLAEEAQVEDAVLAALNSFGRIDVLINNAGVREVAAVWETSTAAWDAMIDTNLKGTFLITRSVLANDMVLRGEGTILFISSASAKRGVEGGAGYCASKWGVLGFAASVTQDVKDSSIRVTTILPGMVETPMAQELELWQLGLDWLDPSHVSRAVVFCVEQDASVHMPELVIHHRSWI